MKNCPYCKAPGNLYFRVSSRNYNRCSGCDLIYKERQDSYDKVLAHYREDYFGRYYFDQVEGSRSRLFNHILDSIEERKKSGSLLDVGTGCGFFLVAAKKGDGRQRGLNHQYNRLKLLKENMALICLREPFRNMMEMFNLM